MVATAFADELRQRHIRYWNDLLNHRFILEIADDSLPVKKFAFYLQQDHIFLKEFCALLLNAKQKSIDQKLVTWFESLYRSTVDSEMHMQKELLLSLGISNIGNSETAAPATLNYSAFLREVSASKDLELTVSSMAPCPWSYLEIAQRLSGNDVKTEVYRKWIQFYASDESRRQVDELKDILGSMYCKTDRGKRLLMEKYFGAACKHEYEFWEMAYKMS
jgi:thiaminase/transcriptional activator TenA